VALAFGTAVGVVEDTPAGRAGRVNITTLDIM
jgi:hypothetical protein